MSQTIYFVTEAYVKLNTPITANVSWPEVLPFVKSSAMLWLRSQLGSYFFDYLLAAYNAQNLTSDETILVELFQPFVAWKAASEAVFELSYQLKNKGLQTQSGDFSSAAELKAIALMAANYSKKAEAYEAIMMKYLYKNKALYPQFTSSLNHDSSCLDYCNQCDRPGSTFNSQIIFV